MVEENRLVLGMIFLPNDTLVRGASDYSVCKAFASKKCPGALKCADAVIRG